ncbi:hypothetical protein NQZ68_016389, partial [Dissostichus eleginoides]
DVGTGYRGSGRRGILEGFYSAGAVFWWLREQQTPPHPSEESSVSSPLSEEGSEELKDMLDSR